MIIFYKKYFPKVSLIIQIYNLRNGLHNVIIYLCNNEITLERTTNFTRKKNQILH